MGILEKQEIFRKYNLKHRDQLKILDLDRGIILTRMLRKRKGRTRFGSSVLI
jgi:hypothetical protein